MKRSIVFVNSVFPCLSETFVYDQFRALQAAGMQFDIASNHRPPASQVHPRMRTIQDDVHYLCETGKVEILLAHARLLLHHPLRYLDTQTNLSRRQMRWMETLQEYDY